MKTRFLLFLLLPLGCVAVFVSVLYRPWAEAPASPAPPRPIAPARLLDMGPVGTDVSYTEELGDLTITMEAARFWVKKTKTFGFDNALMRRLAAKDFKLTISRADTKLLELRNPQLEMPLDRGLLVIDHPEILFPADFGSPDSITFDRKNKLIRIRRAAKEEVWNLADGNKSSHSN